MKHRIVLVPFPFDDLSATKVRPAVCLTDEVRPYGQVVLAFITSKISNPNSTDLVINASDRDFRATGLKASSTIRLHRLMTVSNSLIQRQLGHLSTAQASGVEERLRRLFQL